MSLPRAGVQRKGVLGRGNSLSHSRPCAQPYPCRQPRAAWTSRGLVGRRKVPPGGARPPELQWVRLCFPGGLTLNITRALGGHGAPTLGEELLVLNLPELLGIREKGHLNIPQEHLSKTRAPRCHPTARGCICRVLPAAAAELLLRGDHPRGCLCSVLPAADSCFGV